MLIVERKLKAEVRYITLRRFVIMRPPRPLEQQGRLSAFLCAETENKLGTELGTDWERTSF
jgi:hypothetical protein